MTVAALTVALAPGCGQAVPPIQDSVVGTWAYVASLDDGTVVVRGEIEIRLGDGPAGEAGERRLEATWTTERVGPADAEVGPQVGRGTATGWLRESEVSLQLNPEMADNNVTLTGRIQDRSIVGRWGYATLVGEVAAGRFVLERR